MEKNFKLIRKVYLIALIPNIIAVLGGTVNVFFDGILVGQVLGEVGLESVNQCLPIYLLLCTIGSLIASGASCLSAISFGSNNKKEAQRIFSVAMTLGMALSVIFCIIGIVFSSTIAEVISTHESYAYVLTYLRITLIGGVFKVMLYVPYFYLRLEGKNKRSMSAMLTMTFLNITLDYIFLFIYDFGVAGAAWASVIATVVACILSFIFLFTDHSNFRFSFKKINKNDLLGIVKLGMPMALNNIVSAIRILLINMILKSMGIAGYTAIFAIVNNLNEFTICIQNGVPQTAGAMTGIFYGEKDTDSVRKLLNTQIIVGSILSGVMLILMMIFSSKIGLLFGSSLNCSFAVKCFSVSLVFATINSVMTYYYNVVEHTGIANIITVCRGCVICVLSCFALSFLGKYIWLFYPISEILTFLVFIVLEIVVAKRKKISRFYLLDESFQKSGKAISFSVECLEEKICEASEKIHAFCEENEFSDKKTMAISLAIEEILTIISNKSLLGQGFIEVRVLNMDDDGIVRIRSGGKRYNPMEVQDDSLDYMGVRMISKLAKKIEYQSTLGLNTLMIFV